MSICCGLLLYLTVALSAALLARVIDNPYSMFLTWRDWLGAVLIGALWPLWLPYLIGMVAWLTFQGLVRSLTSRLP